MRGLSLGSVLFATVIIVGCGGSIETTSSEGTSFQMAEVSQFRPSIEFQADAANAAAEAAQPVATNNNPHDGTWACTHAASGQTSVIEIANGSLRDLADGTIGQVAAGYGLVAVAAQPETGASPSIQQVAKVGAMTATLPAAANSQKSSFEVMLTPEGGLAIVTFSAQTGGTSITNCDRLRSV